MGYRAAAGSDLARDYCDRLVATCLWNLAKKEDEKIR